MGIFERISKVVKEIGKKVDEAVDKIKDRIKDLKDKAKDIGKKEFRTHDAIDVASKALELVPGVGKVNAKLIKEVANSVKRLVSSNRIRDKDTRDKAIKKSAKVVSKAVRKVAKGAVDALKQAATISKTREVLTKRSEEEKEDYNKEVEDAKAKLHDYLSVAKEGIEQVEWAPRYKVDERLEEIVRAYEEGDKEKAEKLIREFIETPVDVAGGMFLILALRNALRDKGLIRAWDAIMKILQIVIAWVGTASFAKWLIEESMQRTMIQIDEARKRGLTEEVERVIELNREMRKWASDTVKLLALGPAGVFIALDYFFKANDLALEITQKAMALDMLAEIEVRPGDIARVLEIAEDKIEKGEPVTWEDVEPYLPKVTLLPPAFKSTIKNFRSDINTIKLDILGLIDDGEYERAYDRFTDLIRKLDEYEDWLDIRRVILEPLNTYKTETDYIASIRRWIEDQKALIRDYLAPHATLVITCSLWPERLYLDESPIEPKPYVEIDVIPGKHIVRAEKEGYHADAVPVEVKEGERKVVRINFEKKPQGYGYLTVITTPDCDVYIGSNPTPLHTPVFRYELPPGKYDIRLVREGYREEEVTVLISEGIEQRVEKTLERIVEEVPTKGSLVIITKPAGAFVTVDGFTHPYKTPTVLLLDPGTHSIKIEKEGYKLIEDTAEIIAGESIRKEYELEPLEELISYRVYIDSEPRGAMVFLDGVYTGRRTPTTLSLGRGTWTIRLELKGYWPAEKTITLR